jgi:hypothetical protein
VELIGEMVALRAVQGTVNIYSDDRLIASYIVNDPR